MKINHLETESDGTRSVEIRSSELSYRALLRCIKKMPGADVIETAHDPMNDNTRVKIRYKNIHIIIETPFSDYIVNCTSSHEAFDKFVAMLKNYQVKWWERFI